MTDVVMSSAAWSAMLATTRRTKARADAIAALLTAGGSLDLYSGATLASLSGATLIRTITVGAWSVGSVQSDGRYPLIPGAFTDAGAGSGTPTVAVFKDSGGDEVLRCTAGVGEGVFRLVEPLAGGTPISRGSFVLLLATDDLPPAPEPEEPPTIDYVETMIADMALYHDGPSDVLESLQGWGSGANWPTSFVLPSSWTAPYGIMWFHVMEDSQNISAGDLARPWRVPGPYTGNQAPNTRIQMRNLQLWYLSMSDVWTLAAHRAAPGSTMYPNNWAEGVDIGNVTWRDESGNGGGASVRDIGRGTYESHNWHSFSSAAPLPPNKGLATAVLGRKILDNTSGADDRAYCRMLAAACGDWYRDASVVSGPKLMGENTTVMGIARLKYVTNNWQLFAWYDNVRLTPSQIRNNPPPFIGV